MERVGIRRARAELLEEKDSEIEGDDQRDDVDPTAAEAPARRREIPALGRSDGSF
jgi:hypothetical protein